MGDINYKVKVRTKKGKRITFRYEPGTNAERAGAKVEVFDIPPEGAWLHEDAALTAAAIYDEVEKVPGLYRKKR
jgi:hypothetical protein